MKLQNYLGRILTSFIILISIFFLAIKFGFGMNLFSLSFLIKALFLFLFLYLILILKKGYSFFKIVNAISNTESKIISETSRWLKTHSVFRKIFYFILIPMFLFVLGVALFFDNMFKYEPAFSVITQPHDQSVVFLERKLGEILAEEKIVLDFKAIEDNLGIVAIRFNTFDRTNDDTLIFRIKEKWGKDWYYENEYKTNQFANYSFYFFGFPIIADSKHKTYEVELVSVNGEPGNAVSLSELLPVFLAKYQFPKSEILSSKKNFFVFIYKKILNMANNRDFTVTSLIFFFPLFAYLIWLLISEKFLSRHYFFLFFVSLAILLDVFLVSDFNDLTFLIVIFLWLFTVRLYRFSYKISLYEAYAFLFISIFSLTIGKTLIANKAADWVYLLLIFAVAQMFIYSVINNKKYVEASKD